jgi:hypothetical protein
MAVRRIRRPSKGRPMKRVVTGVNEQGRSYAVSVEELDTSIFDAVWSYEPGQIP